MSFQGGFGFHTIELYCEEEKSPNCYSVTFMPAPSLEFRYLNDVAKVKKGIVFSISHRWIYNRKMNMVKVYL